MVKHMTPAKQAHHEAIKSLLKQAVDNNPNLSSFQKQIVKQRIDVASQQTNWIMENLRQCGYLQ